MDEAWRFIQHPTLRAYVQEGLKTWRKRNAAMILATQTVDDFASADLLRTVVESCPTKLLLANPALDRQRYAELFQLNEMELDLLTGLIARQQILLKRPDLAKVLTLTVDPKSYWIYTNTPIDNERVAETFRRVRIRGGPRPSRRVLVTHGRCGMSWQGIARIAAVRIVASGLTPTAGVAQTPGIREVSASSRSLIPLQTRAAVHHDDRAARRRGDPRRRLRRQGLLGDQRDAQHRAREAREGRRGDESEPGDGERFGLFLLLSEEERLARI